MSVRIIAGSAKGRRLKVPASEGLRPTGDRARESLFNVLAPRLAGAVFLDGFAGSGAVGIEALSRGAARAVFVERDGRVVGTLADNLALCGFVDASEVIRAPCAAALRALARRDIRFDVAFFDPPYDRTDADALLEGLERGRLLEQGGVAIVEHPSRSPVQPRKGWELHRALAVGDTSFSFFGILT